MGTAEGGVGGGAGEEPRPGTSMHVETADALAAIVESSNDAIYTKDSQARITSWNRAAERMYGYSAAEAIGQPLAIIIPEHRKGEEMEILTRILRGERVTHFETQRIRKDGRLVDVSISVSPVHDANGDIVEAAVIGRDVTAMNRLERALEDVRTEQLEAERKEALALNDEVVQGLVVAKMAFETGHNEHGVELLTETLERAKEIVTRLMAKHKAEHPVRPGDLVREEPSALSNGPGEH